MLNVDSMLQGFNYLIPIGTFILGVLGYERIVKKDSNKNATDMAVLLTKVDMLLNNSNEVKKEIKEHSKTLAQHDIKINKIEDTLRIKKISILEDD